MGLYFNKPTIAHDEIAAGFRYLFPNVVPVRTIRQADAATTIYDITDGTDKARYYIGARGSLRASITGRKKDSLPVSPKLKAKIRAIGKRELADAVK